MNLANKYWDAMIRKNLKASVRIQSCCWKPSPRNVLKVNFDTTWENGGQTISACLIRDSNKEVIGIWINRGIVRSAYEAKARAYVFSLKIADIESCQNWIFEGDYLNDIIAIHGHTMEHEWTGDKAVNEAKCLLQRQANWKLIFANRDCNSKAHNIAFWAKSNTLVGYISPSRIPPSIIFYRGGTNSEFPLWMMMMMIFNTKILFSKN